MSTSDTSGSWMALAFGLSVALSLVLLFTAESAGTRLGAPQYWPWFLTGLQVLALWSAGTGRWWGWLLGAAVQPPWIAYALATGQLGFLPGCVVSATVQTYSFINAVRRSQSRFTGPMAPRPMLQGGNQAHE